MMQVVSKWKIIVNIPWTPGTSPDREFCFWIYDNHAANVLRKIADLQFTETGLEQISAIQILLVGVPHSSSGEVKS